MPFSLQLFYNSEFNSHVRMTNSRYLAMMKLNTPTVQKSSKDQTYLTLTYLCYVACSQENHTELNNTDRPQKLFHYLTQSEKPQHLFYT